MPQFLENSRGVLRMFHLEPVDLRKRVLMYPMSSVYQQDSRLIVPLGLGRLMGLLGTWDDLELLAISGSWNSCVSFQEFNLSNNS